MQYKANQDIRPVGGKGRKANHPKLKSFGHNPVIRPIPKHGKQTVTIAIITTTRSHYYLGILIPLM